MSLVNRLREEAQNGGYAPHPLGDFPGKIVEVNRKQVKERWVFEVAIKTPRGRARKSYWVTRSGDIGGELLRHANGDRAKAEERYVQIISGMMRTYNDLGLAPIAGETETEIERQVYGRLGEWIGRDCRIVVKANDRDANNPTVYINAPQEQRSAGARGGQSSATNLPPDQGGWEPGGYDPTAAPDPLANDGFAPDGGSVPF